MGANGKLTTWIVEKISGEWGKRGFDVLYHHGKIKDNPNVGEIASWFGGKYKTEAKLSKVDIAIVKKISDHVLALIEIEDGEETPKKLISDIFGMLMGDHIHSVYKKRDLIVNEHTVLIVMGKSNHHHPERIKYLHDMANKIKPSLSTGNSIIKTVYVDAFSSKDELEKKLNSYLEEAFFLTQK